MRINSRKKSTMYISFYVLYSVLKFHRKDAGCRLYHFGTKVRKLNSVMSEALTNIGLDSSWVRSKCENLSHPAGVSFTGPYKKERNRERKFDVLSTHMGLFHLYTFSHLSWWCHSLLSQGELRGFTKITELEGTESGIRRRPICRGYNLGSPHWMILVSLVNGDTGLWSNINSASRRPRWGAASQPNDYHDPQEANSLRCAHFLLCIRHCLHTRLTHTAAWEEGALLFTWYKMGDAWVAQ